jgi:hypothetical protein
VGTTGTEEQVTRHAEGQIAPSFLEAALEVVFHAMSRPSRRKEGDLVQRHQHFEREQNTANPMG